MTTTAPATDLQPVEGILKKISDCRFSEWLFDSAAKTIVEHGVTGVQRVVAFHKRASDASRTTALRILYGACINNAEFLPECLPAIKKTLQNKISCQKEKRTAYAFIRDHQISDPDTLDELKNHLFEEAPHCPPPSYIHQINSQALGALLATEDGQKIISAELEPGEITENSNIILGQLRACQKDKISFTGFKEFAKNASQILGTSGLDSLKATNIKNIISCIGRDGTRAISLTISQMAEKNYRHRGLQRLEEALAEQGLNGMRDLAKVVLKAENEYEQSYLLDSLGRVLIAEYRHRTTTDTGPEEQTQKFLARIHLVFVQRMEADYPYAVRVAAAKNLSRLLQIHSSQEQDHPLFSVDNLRWIKQNAEFIFAHYTNISDPVAVDFNIHLLSILAHTHPDRLKGKFLGTCAEELPVILASAPDRKEEFLTRIEELLN